jgi:hypothetical protein
MMIIIYLRETQLQQFHEIRDPPTQRFTEVMFVFDMRHQLM